MVLHDIDMLLSMLRRILQQGIDAILPPRCVVTGDMVERQGMISASAWARLDFIANPLCVCCGVPFSHDVSGEGVLCTSCLEHRPPYRSARSVLFYNDASRDLVLGFKHGDKTHAVTAFVPWMERVGAEILAGADCLVPVPLHRWRLLKRRYNQSALIAQALSKATGLRHMPEALIRTRATPPQGHMNVNERYKNVRGAFVVHPRYKNILKGKKIILIDDVFTSGATVGECAKVLLKAGADCVDILTLARVVRENT